jgi:hypothetical protein
MELCRTSRRTFVRGSVAVAATAEDYAEAREHIFAAGRKAGLSFG